ncbi:MAG: zinc-ribbon domain containing protein [Acutalibacteraceae bacterium]
MEKQVVCKSCGSPFTLTENQIAFYEGRGWPIPKHCKPCIENNRKERADRYYGLDEAMTNYTPCKKRRQRVHYKPHIVGGFR